MRSNIQSLDQHIKKILLHDWDPIGVGQYPEADDEYDAYIPHIRQMIVCGKHAKEICDYLLWLENEQVGLHAATRRRTVEISEKLSRLAQQTE